MAKKVVRWGMTTAQYDAYLGACAATGLKPRITQTIGNCKASAGTHLQDGTKDGQPYCAAADFSIAGLTQGQIRAFCAALAYRGWAPFARIPGVDGWPKGQAPHIHSVFAALPMKKALRDQCHDWLHNKSGLRSHGRYTFYTPDEQRKQLVRALFLANNPANG